MLSFGGHISAKVRFLTFHYNNPQFIEMQYKTFKKFMLDDYELIVFNDAKEPSTELAIMETCKKYDIQCVRYEQQWHKEQSLNYQITEWLKDPNIIDLHHFVSRDPQEIGNHASVRHCHVIKYAFENYGKNHNDIVVIVDGDAFPIKPFSVRSLLSDCAMAGLLKYNYLWVVFIAFDPRTLPDINDLKFDIAVIDNCINDTGSYTYHYLKNNPNIVVKTDSGICSDSIHNKDVSTLVNEGFTNPEIELIKNRVFPPVIFNWERHFFHFFSASFNWHDRHKENNVENFVNAILLD